MAIAAGRTSRPKRVAIVGAGVFGLSLALALQRRGHHVTVFDRNSYDKTGYQPADDKNELAASVDHNKIFRASYGKKLHYQQLALESRKQWLLIDQQRHGGKHKLFVPSGMLRVQPDETLSALEKETLANMERDGIRETQFVKSNIEDRNRAAALGWQDKLLDVAIPAREDGATFEAVLDSLAGFTRCGDACAYYRELAESEGVDFVLGPDRGRFTSLVEEQSEDASRQATGLKTADGQSHAADTVVIAAGSFSTQVLPRLAYHLESSAGSIATFKIDPKDQSLWDKYSPDNFPVLTWKSAPRDKGGKDTGSVYVLPRTPEGLVKIGYRGVKFTNFQSAPASAAYSQDGKWSIPLPANDCNDIPQAAADAIRYFVSIFLPDFKDTPFYLTKMCWYTDSLDNSFVIDYVPDYSDSVFVCTGGSGHGAKFMPVLGEHASDVFENRELSTTPMRDFWRWREDVPRLNGLEEGPGGHRNIGRNT